MAISTATWLKVGAVAALWSIVAGAALTGWAIGKGESARRISELQQRLSSSSGPPGSTCGIEVELLNASPSVPNAAKDNLFGISLGGILPKPPHHLHLREMLTAH